MGQKHAQPGGLWELAALFTRLGFTAFGGPAAHVALMAILAAGVIGATRYFVQV